MIFPRKSEMSEKMDRVDCIRDASGVELGALITYMRSAQSRPGHYRFLKPDSTFLNKIKSDPPAYPNNITSPYSVI